MSAVMGMPMDTMVASGAMMTDDARAMHGQHPAATSSSDKGGIDGGIIVIIGIVIRIVVVIDAANKSSAEVTPVSKGAAGKSRTSCDDRRPGADRAATNDSATKAAATAHTATAVAAATAMSAANFNRQRAGNRLARACHSRINRRQRFGALAGNGRHHQQCRNCAQHAQRTSCDN